MIHARTSRAALGNTTKCVGGVFGADSSRYTACSGHFPKRCSPKCEDQESCLDHLDSFRAVFIQARLQARVKGLIASFMDWPSLVTRPSGVRASQKDESNSSDSRPWMPAVGCCETTSTRPRRSFERGESKSGRVPGAATQIPPNDLIRRPGANIRASAGRGPFCGRSRSPRGSRRRRGA